MKFVVGLLVAALVGRTVAQKLVLVIVDGLAGTTFHRFAHLPGFRTFEEEGVWSTRLFPVFPTFAISNRHSLLTGVLPRRHGLIGDYMMNWRTGETFNNFTRVSDLDSDWWTVEPIYVSATKAKASAALFFFPECEVNWEPPIRTCVPPRTDGRTFADESEAKAVVQATKTHDLVIVNHPWIGAEIAAIGVRHANAKTSREIIRFQQSLERLTSQARERIDLNVLLVSTHGLVDVPRQNIRVLDEFVPMELLNTTVGSGAVKQLIVKPGKTHQIYSQLRHHNPIPNVKVYYTTQKISDMPEWYHYKKSETVADLVLIADPGYVIVTKDAAKQFPKPHLHEVPKAVAGYNSQFPDVIGVFLAYGPAFQGGYRKGAVEIFDVYSLMCSLLSIKCNPTPGRILRIDDVLTSEARVAIRKANSTSSTLSSVLVVFLLLCHAASYCL